MSRTRPIALILLAVLGIVVGWLLETALVASGRAVLLPPATLSVALLCIAAIVLAVGWPIRQAVRGHRSRRIDPFRAMRTVLLAQACSLVGALLGGFGLGVLLYLASRSVLPSGGSLWLAGVAAASAAVMLCSGLLVEHWCRIPPGDQDRGSESAPMLED